MTAAIPAGTARPVQLPIKNIDEFVNSAKKVINDSFGTEFESITSKLGPIFNVFSRANEIAELSSSDALIEKLRARKEQRESYEQLYGPDPSEDPEDKLLDLFLKNQEEFFKKLGEVSGAALPLVDKLNG